MGLSELEKVCNEHPYHDQKLGVCPSCLREKLAQLHVVALNDKVAAAVAMGAPSSASSMSLSSASSSNHMSPIHNHHHHHHQRNLSDIMNSISFRVISAGNGLKKSRSMAFVTRSSLVVGEGKHGKKKKKGFWSKLLHLKGKKEVNFDGNKIALNI